VSPDDTAAPGPGAPATALADPATRALAALGRQVQFARGDLLMREGEPGGSLYVVLAGRLRIFVADAQGRELVLAHAEGGSLVGEFSLDGGLRSASVQALEPTACAQVTREDLLEAISLRPELALHLVDHLIARSRQTTDALRDLALKDVYGRVARLLLEMPVEPGPDGLMWSKEVLTQQEVARRVGASRDMVSRIFKDLRIGGYIRQREGRISVLRRPPARW
jgi:CRP/FNR family cyclic AMP-dependent transcriptional regulator